MLTMGKPIQTKCARPMGILGEMFWERIRGNHEQLRGHIDPADILHFLSVPPELYIAGTGMTTLVNQQGGMETPNVELSLLNNVLNRILVAAHMDLTYQDRVFVENILRKLGVADVRGWIRQVQMGKEAAGTVRELLSLYESGWDMVRMMREYRREHTEWHKTPEAGEKAGEEAGRPEASDRFAALVLKRLQTAAVYREVSSHAAVRFGSRMTIDRREMAFGGQQIAASYLALYDDRSRISAHGQTSVYHLQNQYEAWDAGDTDETYRQTADHFLQVALLNAVRQIFHIRYEEFTKRAEWRHEFMDALHVSVRSDLKRIENFFGSMFFTRQDQDAYHRTVQHYERQEINVLKNLFAKGTEGMLHALYDEEAAQTPPQGRNILEKTHETERKFDVMRQEHGKLREQTPQEGKALFVERMEEIREQLERINRQNIERMERLSEYTGRTEKQTMLHIDRGMARTDALRALNGQEQTVSAYRERELPYTAYRERKLSHTAEAERETEKLREILGEETVRLFETIHSYREDPGRYPNVTTSDGQAINLFLRDIAAADGTRTALSEAGRGSVVYDEIRRVDEGEVEYASEGTLRGAQPGKRRQDGIGKETRRTAELFHRQSEQTLNEEKLRELMQVWTRDQRIQNTVVRETASEEERLTGIVHEKVSEMTRKQDEEIARMIGQNVKRQLDTLSEKVYGKLERRMDAERRRRGL